MRPEASSQPATTTTSVTNRLVCDVFPALRSLHDSTASSASYTTSACHMVVSASKSGGEKHTREDSSTDSPEQSEIAEDTESTPHQDETAPATGDSFVTKRKKKKLKKKDKAAKSGKSRSSAASSSASGEPKSTSAKAKSVVDVAVEKELAKQETTTPTIDKTIFSTLKEDPARAFIELEAVLILTDKRLWTKALVNNLKSCTLLPEQISTTISLHLGDQVIGTRRVSHPMHSPHPRYRLWPGTGADILHLGSDIHSRLFRTCRCRRRRSR